MAAANPASRHSRAADVVEECMMTLEGSLSQDVRAAGIGMQSFNADGQIQDAMTRNCDIEQ